MGAIEPDDLLRQWSSENISAEMAIGQMIQQLVKLNATVDTLKETVTHLRNETSATPATSKQQPTLHQRSRSTRRS